MKKPDLIAVFALGLPAVLLTGCGALEKVPISQEETVSMVPFEELMPELNLSNVRDIFEVTTAEQVTTPPKTMTEEETTTMPPEPETTSPYVELPFSLPVSYGDYSYDVAGL